MLPGETVLSKQAITGEKPDEHVRWEVMHTGAGYYVGTVFIHCGEKTCSTCGKDDMPKGFQEPNSRETDYFKTREQADKALEEFKKSGELEGQRY